MISKQLVEFGNFIELNKQFRFILKNSKLYKILKDKLVEFPRQNADQKNIFKVWARQCEFVLAHRIRRGQQMITLYAKWWEERALKEFFRNVRQDFMRTGRKFLLGAVGVAYNWQDNRIPDEEFTKHYDDLEYAVRLKEHTVPCTKCDEDEKKAVVSSSYDDWVFFIRQDDIIIWRRALPSGLFEYKVYASYHDVSAEDFLNVQVDVDYRRKWDTTAVVLEIGEREIESNSDILYWEMLWPRFFSNRDYVFNRRFKIDEESKTILIVNKITEHPLFPKYPQKYRVEEYWSVMVIKPYTDLKNPGIEFSLTYYDNPGVNVPSTITSWVSSRAMPDYLVRLRNASKAYRDYCIKEGISKACDRLKEEEIRRRTKEARDTFEYCSYDGMVEESDSGNSPNKNDSPEKKSPNNTGDVSGCPFTRWYKTPLLNCGHGNVSENILDDIKCTTSCRPTKICPTVKLYNNATCPATYCLRRKVPGKSNLVIKDRLGKNYEKSQESSHTNVQKDINNSFWKYLHPLYYFS